jgi:DNA-binding response OmpR family regulator
MKILLVEDHKDIAEVIFEFFELHHHELDYATNGFQGFELGKSSYYDVIILDIMLPGLSGLDVCKKLRAEGIDTPILMLTARDSNQDILNGFEEGADDYLVKPFDLNILAARVNALYRRRKGSSRKEITYGDLVLDTSSYKLTRKDCEFQLNQTLFNIMKLLILRAPSVVSRQEIEAEIWGDNPPDSDVLRSHVYQLRNKIDKPFKHHYLKTIPKVGYQLVNEAGSIKQ